MNCEKCTKKFKDFPCRKRRFCSYICAVKSPWNTIQKRGKNNISKRIDVRKKMSESAKKVIKERRYNWKGNRAGYVAIHIWIKNHWGKPIFCEFNKSHIARRFEWANKDGLYNREKREDWMQLCPSCHRKYDYRNNITKAIFI